MFKKMWQRKKQTLKDLKAYKLFINNPNVLLYGKLNNETNEIDYYHFDFDRSFLIYVTKESNVTRNTEYLFSIASVKTSDLMLSNDNPPYLPENYVYDEGYVIEISIENFKASDEKEALEIFLENIYNKQPFDIGYGYCNFFPKKPALMTDTTYAARYSDVVTTMIVTERLPDYNHKNTNVFSKTFINASNVMTTNCFNLICSEYCFSLEENGIQLENFASCLGSITQSKLGNLTHNWNHLYQMMLKDKTSIEKATKILE